MNVTIEDVEMYLEDVKEAINAGRYRIAMNENRQDNRDLFVDYVISEEQRKQILLSLEATDFSEIKHNTHKGYEHELLYVFGKDVELLERMGNTSKTVSLYIKFNKMDSCYVIVVSLHEQRYPIKYYFK